LQKSSIFSQEATSIPIILNHSLHMWLPINLESTITLNRISNYQIGGSWSFLKSIRSSKLSKTI
jgi:hypothetical protein